MGTRIRSKIRPDDIRTGGPFAPIFGFDRANVAANTLVRLAQQNGSWRAFAIGEVDRLVQTPFVFNGLTSGRHPLIIQLKDGRFAFTNEFIEKCASSAPRKRSSSVGHPLGAEGAPASSATARHPWRPQLVRGSSKVREEVGRAGTVTRPSYLHVVR